jgi:hypothetical protein
LIILTKQKLQNQPTNHQTCVSFSCEVYAGPETLMLNVNQMLHVPFSWYYSTHFPAESKILQTKKRKSTQMTEERKTKEQIAKII